LLVEEVVLVVMHMEEQEVATQAKLEAMAMVSILEEEEAVRR